MWRQRHEPERNRLAAVGVGVAALYWLCESVLHAYVLDQGPFLHQLLPRNSEELWTRGLVAAVIIGFGWAASTVVRQRDRARRELLAAQQSLEQRVEERTQQLMEHTAGLAMMQERERLSRDLHDSVTQTLFSASLIADALPKLWERDPGQARGRLRELRRLTREALTELRTLLVDLRPTSVSEVSLGDLLHRLSDELSDGNHFTVEVTVEGDLASPNTTKTALYRIAGEALTNAARHSGARTARVILRSDSERVELLVEDDGEGFQEERNRPGSLGLAIMQERAEEAGIRLQVRSREGEGTQVAAIWPRPHPGTGRRSAA